MHNRIIALIVVLIVNATIAQNGIAQSPVLSGTSDFLVGVWTFSGSDFTTITLHNPTVRPRVAVAIFYGENEDFLRCEVAWLSPHRYYSILCPTCYNGIGTLADKQGAVEILSGPQGTEDPNQPGGLIGYINISSPKSDSPTQAVAPMFPLDTKLFNIENRSMAAVGKCVCKKFDDLRSIDMSHHPLYSKFGCGLK
jgi:hypothetical protein